MTKAFLAYWTPDTVDRAHEHDDGSIRHAASEQFSRVNVGDTVWLGTVREGDLRLVTRIKVGAITSRARAARQLGVRARELWEAKHHIIAEPGTEQPLREVPLASAAEKLRFESSTSPALKLVAGQVNPQQLQTLRVLTPQTADLLESVWGQATHDKVAPAPRPAGSTQAWDELEAKLDSEGRAVWRLNLQRERSAANRKRVLQSRPRPWSCDACSFDFGAAFGPDYEDYIEVHHAVPVAAGERVPKLAEFNLLCANCHTIAHWKQPLMPLNVEQLRLLLKRGSQHPSVLKNS